jgi:metal-responsive CopG/Arc/MetJ family transcriptional regulator
VKPGPKAGHWRKSAGPGGVIRKTITLRLGRYESVEEIAAEKGGLSLSGTIDDLLRLGIDAYREQQRNGRRTDGVAV